MKTNCHEISRLIPLYSDNGLSVEEKQLVEQHIAGCEKCKQEVLAYKKIWEMLAGIERIEPAPNYISRFWTELSSRMPWHENFLNELKTSLSQKRLVPVFVTMSVIILLSIVSIRNYFQIERVPAITAALSETELEIIEYMQLAEDYDIVEEIDFFEETEALL